MEHAQEGLCAVCGVNTPNRCASYAEHGFDLFLCGREHQKLIWFAHKRICGVNSNPLRLPLLTAWEYEQLKQTLSEAPIRMTPGTPSNAEYLGLVFNRPASEAPRLLAHLREGARPTSLGADQITHLLSGLRDDLIQRTCYTTAAGGFSVFHPEEELPLEALDPFFLLADYMAEFDMSLRDLGISTTSLSLEHGPRILHQLIVYRTLRYKRRYKELASPSFSSSPQGQALEKYLFSAIQRLVDTLNVVHRQDHRVSDALRKVFFKVFDGVPVGIVKGELDQGGVTDYIVFAME